MSQALGYPALLLGTAPEILIALAGLWTLTLDLVLWRNHSIPERFQRGAIAALVGCGLAIAAILVIPTTVSTSMLVVDPLIRLVQLVLVVLAILILMLSTSARFTEHVGEYLALILFATAAMMVLVSTENLLLIFLAIEFLSLSLYILTGFDKRSAHSSEAALKYFLFGGMSAGFFLFGISLLYGVSGSLDLGVLAAKIADPPPGQPAPGLMADPVLLVAIVMVVAGLGFKIAAAPFHFWAPDAYQGGPSWSAGFVASSSKVASFFILFEIMVVGLAAAAGDAAYHRYAVGWAPLLAIVAVISMVWGNLAAIAQTSLRRLLAYSATAHAGYVLIALVAGTQQSFSALIYYIATYALATLGAFGVLAALDEAGIDSMAELSGLSRRAPGMSFCLLIFLLSLAGIPPLAGFFGKFYVFIAALNLPNHLGLLWLVLVAIGMSVVSLYYYLKVLKRVYVSDPPEQPKPINIPWMTSAAVWAMAALILLFGCAPSLLLGKIAPALAVMMH